MNSVLNGSPESESLCDIRSTHPRPLFVSPLVALRARGEFLVTMSFSVGQAEDNKGFAELEDLSPTNTHEEFPIIVDYFLRSDVPVCSCICATRHLISIPIDWPRPACGVVVGWFRLLDGQRW